MKKSRFKGVRLDHFIPKWRPCPEFRIQYGPSGPQGFWVHYKHVYTQNRLCRFVVTAYTWNLSLSLSSELLWWKQNSDFFQKTPTSEVWNRCFSCPHLERGEGGGVSGVHIDWSVALRGFYWTFSISPPDRWSSRKRKLINSERSRHKQIMPPQQRFYSAANSPGSLAGCRSGFDSLV